MRFNVKVNMADFKSEVVENVERIATSSWYHNDAVELVTMTGEERVFHDVHSLEVRPA